MIDTKLGNFKCEECMAFVPKQIAVSPWCVKFSKAVSPNTLACESFKFKEGRVKEENNDEIKRPNHYNWHPRIECKDVIKYFDAPTSHALKYLWRHEHKGTALKDLKKAKEWIDVKISMLEEDEK